MNKQIKRLLACAHLEIAAEDGKIDTNKVAERFAHLIIEECCGISHKVLVSKPKGLDPEMGLEGYFAAGALACAVEIRNHFKD